jgi:porin
MTAHTGWCHKICVTACVVAGLASALGNPLHAQQIETDSLYDGPLLDRPTLTGDWGGTRDVLAARGITFAPSLTQFYQGPIAGNTAHKFYYGAKGDVLVNIDGAKLGFWDGFGMQMHGEYNLGKTPGVVAGTTFPNNTAMTFPYLNQPGGDLTSLFFSQRFGPNFTVVAGKMNMFDFYTNGHEFSGGGGTKAFWNTSFVGPPSGIVPVAMFGAIGTLNVDPLKFTGMVYDPRDAITHTGLVHPFDEGVNLRGSADLTSNLLGLRRTDSFMAAISSEKGTDFSKLTDLGTAELRKSVLQGVLTGTLFGSELFTPPQKRGRYWFGYAFEQTLWRNPENPKRAWGLFGQAGISDGNPNTLKLGAIGGIGGTSPFAGRPDDKFGIGAFYLGYSNELKQHLDPLVQLGDEYGGEIFYNFAITKWFRLTADAQVIAPGIKAQATNLSLINPTVARNPTVVLLGLRSQLNF